ncbi:MAG: ATP-dependent DNA helicase RecG [Deltaproteobacteria bacterium DG_8]|nr:MAG: ATP-dependent DNA helicase RecG [Deltaproteobacteria bacterium DG_8]
MKETKVDSDITVSDRVSFGGVKQLSTPIQFIKGVGPKLSEVLGRKGICTVSDALYFLPRKYEDRREIKKISEIKSNTIETIKGTILTLDVVPYKGGRKRIFEMAVGDGTGTIIAKWFQFNERYMKKRFKKEQHVILSGELKRYLFQKEIHHPEIEVTEPGEEKSWEFKQIIPIYSETEGLYQKTMRRIMRKVIDEHSNVVIDGIPEHIRKRQYLMSLPEAIKKVHFPEVNDDFKALSEGRSPAHRRLIFDEFFFLELGLALRKRGVILEEGISFFILDNYTNKLKSILPFELTSAQERVVGEIIDELRKPYPMNRLLQGDVGSGKTIVALIASLIVIENGYQAAFMAPTEILAEQHYSTILPFAGQLGLKVALLTSSIKRSMRSGIYQEIEEGKVNIIIGTHAVIQEAVQFHKLGLAIIDEQHRFGVMQRAMLKKKGMNPDVLVMTATPIPRTLGLTVYGDLDISVIDQMPPGRLPVKTKLYHEKDREKVYQKIKLEVENNRQIFIVYPLIEESEKLDLMNATQMAEHLQKDVFPNYKIGLLHGRMEGGLKEKIMSDFQSKKIDVLVSTTVVEVGIDIPNASLMVVEHAERFGLSQLHQLRGRVGRGEYQSQCILLAQYKKSDDARRRLKIMEQSTDGFKIAEEDFAIRGPGEFLGTRQSGIPDFRVANIVRDVKILNEARKEAFQLIEEDPRLSLPEHSATKMVLKERWKGRLELASIG